MFKVFVSLLFLVCANFGFVNSAFAKKHESKGLSEKSRKILAEINQSLGKISEMRVGFRQVFEGKSETGYAEFKKDYGIFIKYQSMPITLLTNKDVTVYYDAKMNQKSELPTKDSATKIFTGHAKIDESIFDIQSISEDGEAYSVVATVKRMKSEGLITMYFSKSDMLLRRVDIKSPEGSVMRVDIYSHVFEAISPERFKAINIAKEHLES